MAEFFLYTYAFFGYILTTVALVNRRMSAKKHRRLVDAFCVVNVQIFLSNLCNAHGDLLLVFVVAKHKYACDNVDENKRAHLKAGAYGAVFLHGAPIGHRHGDAPRQRNERNCAADTAEYHQNFCRKRQRFVVLGNHGAVFVACDVVCAYVTCPCATLVAVRRVVVEFFSAYGTVFHIFLLFDFLFWGVFVGKNLFYEKRFSPRPSSKSLE